MAKNNGKIADKGPFSVLTRSFVRGAYVDHLTQATIQYYQILLRTPPLQGSVIDTALRMNASYGRDAVRGIFNAGDFSRKKLSILENLQYLEENFNNITEDHFIHIYNRTTRPLVDMDVMITTENTDPQTKSNYRNEFERSLPKPPESIREHFEKFDIHRDTTVTEAEFVDTYESFKNPLRTEELHLDKQQEQFLSIDPEKEILPVVLFVSNDASPQFRGTLNKHFEGGHIQNHAQYLGGPWKEAALSFKERFPDYHSEITESIRKEVEEGVYGIENETLKSFVLNTLSL